MINSDHRESRLMLRLVSLMLAILIWFQMSGRVAESERILTRSYRPFLEFQTIPGEDIEPKSDYLMVGVTISGPDQVLQQLQEQDIRVEVPLNGLKAGSNHEVTLSPTYVILPKGLEKLVKVERLNPPTVRVDLIQMTTKTLKVQAFPKGKPAENFSMVGEIRLSHPVLKVRGPTKFVDKLDNLITEVDISGLDKTTTGTLQFRSDQLPKDTAIENLGNITFTVVIQEKEDTRILEGDWPVTLEDRLWSMENSDTRVKVNLSGPISALGQIDPAWIVVRANTRIPPPQPKIDPSQEGTTPNKETPVPEVPPDTRLVPLIGSLKIPDNYSFEDPAMAEKITRVRLQCSPARSRSKNKGDRK